MKSDEANFYKNVIHERFLNMLIDRVLFQSSNAWKIDIIKYEKKGFIGDYFIRILFTQEYFIDTDQSRYALHLKLKYMFLKYINDTYSLNMDDDFLIQLE